MHLIRMGIKYAFYVCKCVIVSIIYNSKKKVE